VNGRRAGRTRVIAAVLLGVVAVLGVFVVIVTVRYRDGLEQRLRADVRTGAQTVAQVRSPATLKSVLASLAGDGISGWRSPAGAGAARSRRPPGARSSP
jgi:hypothetical protein